MRASTTTKTTRITLDQAAKLAQGHHGPLRAWARYAGVHNEVYFHNDVVLHARRGEQTGMAALRAMFADRPIVFTAQSDRWPETCSVLMPWGNVRSMAFRDQPMPLIMSARYRDEEATPHLGPRDRSRTGTAAV